MGGSAGPVSCAIQQHPLIAVGQSCGEKVIAGGSTVTIKVRALSPGRYRFFDDYHEATTQGFLVAQ